MLSAWVVVDLVVWVEDGVGQYGDCLCLLLCHREGVVRGSFGV